MALNQSFNQDAGGNIGIAAAVTTSSPAYTTGTTAALSLTLNGLLRVDGSGVTQPISATSLPLPTGAATSALQTSGNATLSAISAQLPTTLGQKTSANSLAVVLASDQSAITITGNIGVAQGSTTAAELGPLVQGAVTTAAPSYTAATTNPLSLTTAGALRVDGSAVTQPISAAALPLPAGASTSSLQTSGNASLTSIDSKTPALGQAVMAASVPVVIASNQSAIPVIVGVSTTATLSSVANSLTTGVLLAANTNRKSYIVFNDSLAVVFLAFAATASTTAFSTKLQPGSEYEPGTDYTGVISAISSAAVGSCRITEFT